MSDMQQFLATAYCPSSVNECKSAIGQQLVAQMIATVSTVELACIYLMQVYWDGDMLPSLKRQLIVYIPCQTRL